PASNIHIVLVEPEIPNNTGNIGRTCINAGAPLHLVHPLGFQTDEKALRRAGMDYWPRVDLTEHPSWESYKKASDYNRLEGPRHWLLTTRTDRCLWDVAFEPGDRLVFGKESSGLDAKLIEAHPERCLTVPMAVGERSLNLASCAAVVAYEALRQFRERGVMTLVDDARFRAK
ncbi:MAG: tRNA (cytidine(34)-2'-O)-methyltransferase, partial [Planctomycetota bacterium]